MLTPLLVLLFRLAESTYMEEEEEEDKKGGGEEEIAFENKYEDRR